MSLGIRAASHITNVFRHPLALPSHSMHLVWQALVIAMAPSPAPALAPPW